MARLAARGGCGGCDLASVVRLGSHAERGGRGGCGSARTIRVVWLARCAWWPWLSSHDARGGCGSARTMRVVAVAQLARCACIGGRSWLLATNFHLPHPK